MPPKDLISAVERLVEVATGDGDDKKLRSAVNAVMKVFEAKDARATRAAITKLGQGVKRADGRAAQVLHLTLGALVEAGASAELAWPVVSAGAGDLLVSATRFAEACLERARDAKVDDALAAAANEVAARRPRDAAAWREVPARCLAAIACLTRSRKLRRATRASGALFDAAAPLVEAIDEVGLLAQVLRMLDGETIIVVHPPSAQVFRATLEDVATNAELLLLLADALAGQGKGKLGGARPDARAVAALRSGKTKKTRLSLDFAEHVQDGVPDDLPTRKGERIAVLRDLGAPEAFVVEPSFPALAPRVRVTRALRPDEAKRYLVGERARTPKRAGARR